MAAYRQVYDSSPAGWLPRTGISSGTIRSAIEYWLPLLFYFWLFTLGPYLRKKPICNPLAHPTWKCTTLTCEMPNFFYLTEGLHSTCIFRTCVFHPCRFVPAFSVLAFSSTCIFSAPAQPTVSKHWRLSAILMASNATETNSEKIVTEIRRTRLCCYA